MKDAHVWLWMLPVVLAYGCDGGPTAPTPTPSVETLAELPNAPTSTVDGRLTCMGKKPPAAAPGAMELTGYVRTLADPDAKQPVPPATVEAFLPDGTSLGSGGVDVTKGGRIAITVPIKAAGFEGYAVVSQTGYLDFRLQSSRAKTTTDLDGWAWLTTPGEIDSRAKALGFDVKAGTGILVGAVHDCDGFGMSNAVVVVGSGNHLVYYVEGFDISPARPYSSSTGRFVAANLDPGTVTVKAFGRVDAGGPLTLLSSAQVTVEAGRMSAIDLQPRTGLK